MSFVTTTLYEKTLDNKYVPHMIGSKPAYISATQGNLLTEVYNGGVVNKITGLSNLEEQLFLGQNKIITYKKYEDSEDDVTIIEYRNRNISKDFYYLEIVQTKTADLISQNTARFIEDTYSSLFLPAGTTEYIDTFYPHTDGVTNEYDKLIEKDDEDTGTHYQTFDLTDDKKKAEIYGTSYTSTSDAPDDNIGTLKVTNNISTFQKNLVVEKQRLWYRKDAEDTDQDILIAIKNVYLELNEQKVDENGNTYNEITNSEEIIQPKKENGFGYMTRAEFKALNEKDAKAEAEGSSTTYSGN